MMLSSFLLLPLLLLVINHLVNGAEKKEGRQLTFGLLNGGSEFFIPIAEGFNKTCQDLGVNCVTMVPEGDCVETRTNITQLFLSMGVDGIAFKPCGSGDMMVPIVDNITAAGVPVVTFDSDSPNSTRVANVGTDNFFMGRTMGRLLRQLRPEGGTFAIVSTKQGRTDGFMDEIMKYNDRDDEGHWHPVQNDLVEEQKDFDGDYLTIMDAFAEQNPTAMLYMTQSPMRHPNWTDFIDNHRHRQITHIGVDGADFQLSYLNRRYIDGLVGQLPFEIGSISAQILYDVVTKGKESLEEELYTTNVVAYNLIPLELPPLNLDENLLGGMKYVGLTCFGVVALSALGCIAWTIYHRKTVVVKAAQPFFLLMVAGGVLILSSSLIPLSFDDKGQMDEMSLTRSVAICMSTPWLAFTGFTVTFSALFAKTWRVNRLFHSTSRFLRMRVTEKDVLAPFVVLLTCNLVVLTLWTVLDPLTYIRQENKGTDYWNRVISTYGACRCENAVHFLTPLAIINIGVVAIACWQAVQARGIQSELSESMYIALTMGSLFQGFLTGIPVVVIVRDTPRAFFIVVSLMVFILSMMVLLLIFLPKIISEKKYARKTEWEQKEMLSHAVKRSKHVDVSGFASMDNFVSKEFELDIIIETDPVQTIPTANRSRLPEPKARLKRRSSEPSRVELPFSDVRSSNEESTIDA